MFHPIDTPIIENNQTLKSHTEDFIETFIDQFEAPSKPVIKLKIWDKSGFPSGEDEGLHPPVALLLPDGNPMLYLRSVELVGRPASILEGGLAMELAAMILLQQHPENFRLNFEREILPMFNLSGSAVQFLRRLVMHLETGLRRLQAARLVIDKGYGSHLLYYYFSIFQPSDQDQRHYKKIIPHQWMRAMYLARKVAVWMPLTILDELDISSGLQEFWWDCHTYLMPEDHQLLVDLAAIPSRMDDQSFASHTAAKSMAIRHRLMMTRSGDTTMPPT
jgi:hypothetical protein